MSNHLLIARGLEPHCPLAGVTTNRHVEHIEALGTAIDHLLGQVIELRKQPGANQLLEAVADMSQKVPAQAMMVKTVLGRRGATWGHVAFGAGDFSAPR